MRRQICLRFEPKVWKKRGKVMSEIKVKFLPKVWSNGVRLKAASKVLSNMFEIQVKSLTKRCCQICLFFFLLSHRPSRSSRPSREFLVCFTLRANAALLPRLAHKALDIQARIQIEISVKFNSTIAR